MISLEAKLLKIQINKVLKDIKLVVTFDILFKAVLLLHGELQ